MKVIGQRSVDGSHIDHLTPIPVLRRLKRAGRQMTVRPSCSSVIRSSLVRIKLFTAKMRFLPQRLFCGITNPLRFPHWGVGTRGARGVEAPIHNEKRGLRNYGLGDCRRRPDEQQRWHPDGHRGRDGRDALPPVGRATLRLHPRQRARARSAVADGLWAAAARLRRLYRLGPGARLHRGLRARGDPAHVR